MASHRPGFVRAETDAADIIMVNLPESSTSTHSNDKTFNSNKDAGTDEESLSKVKSIPPTYQSDEGIHGESNAIETAEDLVTKVIDLDDDPTQNPWTFRTFFLGM